MLTLFHVTAPGAKNSLTSRNNFYFRQADCGDTGLPAAGGGSLLTENLSPTGSGSWLSCDVRLGLVTRAALTARPGLRWNPSSVRVSESGRAGPRNSLGGLTLAPMSRISTRSPHDRS